MGQLPYEKAERTVLVKRPGVVGDPYIVDAQELIRECVIVVNKTRGPTSHQIADWTKKILGQKKAGQAGTLDPNVTGLLPVAVGRATNVIQVLLKSGKEYICYMHLHGDVDEQKLRAVLADKFVGTISQFPPVKSAVKRRWRTRKIYYLDVLEVDGREVLFSVGCQAGTYIRKLCSDIGDELGCGAHMQQLVRTKSGGFGWDERVTLQDVADAVEFYTKNGDESLLRRCLLPVEELVRHLPKIWVRESAIAKLAHGVQLDAGDVVQVESGIEPDENVAVMSPEHRLVMVGDAIMNAKQIMKNDSGRVCTTFRVMAQVNQ